MKNRCYPKYSYIVFIILAMIMFMFSIAPLFIETTEGIIIKITWSVLMFLLGIVFIIAAIQHMQYYYFDNNHVIVKSLFGTIVKLNIEKVQVYIEILPTYFSWVMSVERKWICIYDESIIGNFLYRFKSGCSNRRKYKRIQIVFNESNEKNIVQYLKINKRQIF